MGRWWDMPEICPRWCFPAIKVIMKGPSKGQRPLSAECEGIARNATNIVMVPWLPQASALRGCDSKSMVDMWIMCGECESKPPNCLTQMGDLE